MPRDVAFPTPVGGERMAGEIHKAANGKRLNLLPKGRVLRKSLGRQAQVMDVKPNAVIGRATFAPPKRLGHPLLQISLHTIPFPSFFSGV
jgi:hypothetical protein